MNKSDIIIYIVVLNVKEIHAKDVLGVEIRK